MDLALSPAAEQFRERFARWLDLHLPSEWCDVPVGLGDESQYVETRREWGRMLAGAGWLAPHWPVAYGGLGLGVDEQVAYLEVLVAAGAPEPMNQNGIGIFAPALLRFGTDEQRRRYLPPMLAHDELWCQGFSEPQAGSDLASLTTRATREGDRFLVTGQKVWTSYAAYADRCYLLVRVAGDPGGLTMVILDMHQRGVTVRPLRTITGTSEFCEIFLDEAVVPAVDVVGPVGAGWQVATYALARERSTGLAQRSLLLARELTNLTRLVGSVGPAAPSTEKFVDAFVRARVVDSLVRRTLALTAEGDGADELLALAPAAKVLWSEAHQQQVELLVEVAGAELVAGDAAWSRWGRLLLSTRAETIYGGTSEIQRNLVAKSLGLPSDRPGRA